MALKHPLEIGKTYRTRGGGEAVCRSFHADSVAGFTDGYYRNQWTGRCNTQKESPLDIVEGLADAHVGVAIRSIEKVLAHGVTDKSAMRGFASGGYVPGRDSAPSGVVGKDEPVLPVTMEPSALETQEGGDHYRAMSLQPWEVLDHWLTREQHLGYLLGTAIAYLGRYNAAGAGKGGIDDVKKARHFLQRMEEVAEREVPESKFLAAVKGLCVCARTTQTVGGRDEGLCAALDRVEAALQSNPPR